MKLKTLTILLMLMVAFTQSFGQTFELSHKNFTQEVFVIGQFKVDKKDSLYHYVDMKSEKYSAFLFGYRFCEGDCQFFAYNNQSNKYYFFSDNVIGYVICEYSTDFAKTIKQGCKKFKVAKVDSESEKDAINEVYNRMVLEYKTKNTLIIESQRLKREKFIKDSIEQVKIEEQKRHEYRQTHNWHTNSVHSYLECMTCNKHRYLDNCYIVSLDSNNCYYLSNDPSLKMLGIEYHELHRSRTPYSLPLVKKYFEMWKDSIDNPKHNPKITPESAKVINEQRYRDFCEKLREKTPYGFITDFGANFNSVNGVEPYFEFFNTNKKTIKYIEFFFSVYNAVNDLCYLDHKPIGSVKGVGPVESFNPSVWSWNRATHYTSGDANYIRITKIVLTYMDGTTKTLSGDSIVIDAD